MPRQRACRLHAAEVGRGLGGDSWDKDPWNSDNVGRLGSDNKAPPSRPNHPAGFDALLAPKGMIMFRRHENRQEHEGRNGHVLPEIEDEFRELVRRGIPRVRAESGNGSVTNLNSLAQSISGPSVREIEKVILQLQDLRDHLIHESQRIQRAITEYAQLSQATVKSTEIIAENLAQWRQPAESSKANHASAAVPQTQGERSENPVDGQPHS